MINQRSNTTKMVDHCCESYKFLLSHKEIFQHCVQTIFSLYPIDHSLPSTTSIETEGPTVTFSKFIKPEIFVVDTHRKEEGKSKESREEKEGKFCNLMLLVLFQMTVNIYFPLIIFHKKIKIKLYAARFISNNKSCQAFL